MTQSIFIQVGQCGNQIGCRFWELALREHARHNPRGVFDESLSSFFRNVRHRGRLDGCRFLHRHYRRHHHQSHHRCRQGHRLCCVHHRRCLFSSIVIIVIIILHIGVDLIVIMAFFVGFITTASSLSSCST
jgi:hypothetical protein